MNDSGTTQCLLFEGLSNKRVEIRFSGAETSSDGGAVFLKAADRRLGLIKLMSGAIVDRRDETRVLHEMETLVSQRVYALGCGYEDGADAARLASDPMMKLVSGRDPWGDDLASQPSISRFENAPRRADLMRIGLRMMEAIVSAQKRRLSGRAKKITIDLDQTMDPVHGEQQLSFFNGFYGNHCFIPLLGSITFNDEAEQFLVAGILRPGNAPDKRGARGLLKRLVPRLRKAFPKAQIYVRLDAGFGCPEILDYLDSEGLRYAVGYGKNAVLTRASRKLMGTVRRLSKESGKTERLFTSTRYAARRWPNMRRIVIKAEVTRAQGREPRDNPRYVVSNIPGTPEWIYAEFYSKRGEFENRIKELKQGMRIDRTSCSKFTANQFRVLLTLAAFMLTQEVRVKARLTQFARATVDRLRLSLIKVAARVTSSVRRILIELPEAYPFKLEWIRVASGLATLT